MNKDLKTMCERLFELDAKRTQGKWLSCQAQSYRAPDHLDFYYSILVKDANGGTISVVDSDGTNLNDHANAINDFCFIAAMPEAIATLREYQRREKIAREALESIGNNTCCAQCQEAKWVAQQALKQLGDMEVKDVD